MILMLPRKSLAWFLVISFTLAWIMFLLPLASGAPGTATRQTVTLVSWTAAMWAPGIAALIVTRYVLKRPVRTLGLGRLGEKRAYLWAWLLPIGLAIATGILSYIFSPDKLDLSFPAFRQAMAAAPGGASLPPGLIVAAQIAISFTLGPLLNTLFALGEELGWRGFLLPSLLPLGQWRAILVSGLIWGAWHAPAILQGHNYPSQPVLGVVMMMVFTILLGAILAWLYLRTGSPWAPALGHGTINAVAGLPVLFLTGINITYTGTLASPVGWIPLLLFVGWLAWTRRLPVAEPHGWASEGIESPGSPATTELAAPSS
jgi:membrane protease YdiL (CAAX protease family)